ncbi:MAG: ATP-binding cassette domain-containing protein [Oscillospiraceae bacterium]|nr:ATP-binding cassette domain-containing protein [Oscillospiraceae bacterium]
MKTDNADLGEEFVLQTDRLCKQYRGSTALDQVSLHIPRGAIYGFVGRNGAGKTTLMRLISGLQEPTRGSYRLFGIENGQREICLARRRMGAVIETPAIYPEMTAGENVRNQCLLLGISGGEEAERVLTLVGLQQTGKKRAGHFSLGMRQRLAIALALVGNPEFLILDEPMNGLDPQGIHEMRALLWRLNRDDGVTILISSHMLDELARLATHYGFLDHGRLLREMSAEELRAACGGGEDLEEYFIQLVGGGYDA